jgi:hypothetical protein
LLSAPDSGGPYEPVGKLPASFSKLPTDATFTDIRGNLPSKAVPADQAPTVFVSDGQAEIIVTTGPAAFKAVPIPATSPQYAINAESTRLKDTSSGRLDYLSSGRWFSAPSLDGPWTFATADLPGDFARIPDTGAERALCPDLSRVVTTSIVGRRGFSM